MTDGAYVGVRGVEYRRWFNGDDEPATAYEAATLDEMKVVSGNLLIRVDTGDGSVSLAVPIKAKPSWNSFVGALPKITNVD